MTGRAGGGGLRGGVVFAMTGCRATPGGIAANNGNLLRTVSELARRRGVPLTVLSYLESDEDRPPFLPRHAAFHGCRGRRIRFAAKLVGLAARHRDLVFDHVTLALPVLPLAAGGAVRTVIFAHGSEAWRRVRRSSRWSLRAAALCLTNSRYTLRRMRRRLGRRFRGRACPLGLPPDMGLNRTPPSEPPQPPVLRAADGRERHLSGRILLLVARMHPDEGRKGHRQLIRALPELRRRFPDVQLVFPGPGDDRFALAEEALRRRVGDAVFLPGFVDTALLRRLYGLAYAYVMPSRQEGFGLTYLEAMNFAKPCVGCRNDGAADVVVHGRTGLLVNDPDDLSELTGVLARLLEDPVRAARMGTAGFRRLHRRFTPRRARERMRAALEEALP